MHHDFRILALKRRPYSVAPVRLGVAENEKESDNIILQLWRRCVPLGLLPSMPLEEDMKAKCWDKLIIPNIETDIGRPTASQTWLSHLPLWKSTKRHFAVNNTAQVSCHKSHTLSLTVACRSAWASI